MGKRLEHIVSKMTKQCYEQKQSTILKQVWTSTDPAGVMRQQAFLKKNKQKERDTSTGTEEKDFRAKRHKNTMFQPCFKSCLGED